MSGENWQVGDLALCIKTDAWRPIGPRGNHSVLPAAGHFYTVRRVKTDSDGEFLAFIEGTGLWRSDRFRKIRPHTPDEQDAETIHLLTGAPEAAEA